MKITKNQLKQLIKEELYVITEVGLPGARRRAPDPNSDPWDDPPLPGIEGTEERLAALEKKVESLMNHVINMSKIG